MAQKFNYVSRHGNDTMGNNNKGNYIKKYTGIDMRQMYTDDFVKTVYYNFIDLSEYPLLKHNLAEIHKLILSPNMVGFFLYRNNKMIGYIIGEVMRLNDGRLVLFISYLYVASKFRNLGYGKVLLEKYIDFAKKMHLASVVLICDTEDNKVSDFYMTKGFMYDQFLRRYDRYDVLSLSLNASEY